MRATYPGIKPSVGTGSLDREQVRAVLAEIMNAEGSSASQAADDEPMDRVMLRARLLAAERVRQSSLRTVAREIGMGDEALRKFLGGTSPYRHRRLREWYLHQTGEESTSVGG
ncbi:MAG TPA: hypothetical protein VHG08_20055 [Longimicrobium sp.]|nr:hypothetical protein [Longimicrobium sp.]